MERCCCNRADKILKKLTLQVFFSNIKLLYFSISQQSDEIILKNNQANVDHQFMTMKNKVFFTGFRKITIQSHANVKYQIATMKNKPLALCNSY